MNRDTRCIAKLTATCS